MFRFAFAVLCALAAASAASAQTVIQPPISPGPPGPVAPSGPLQIQPPTLSADLRITWEVKNRFRLFRREADFLKHVAALSAKSILQAEQIMASETDGRGWARGMVTNLCIDATGNLMNTCDRDGARESYLAPTDHRVEMKLSGAPAGATCAWTFDDGDSQPRSYNGPCSEEVRIRLLYGKPTVVTVDAATGDGPPQRATTEIAVRDMLIAGLGDSIAAGEGNPDRPVALSDEGFCFRRFLGGTRSEYFRPGRANFNGDRTCEAADVAGGVTQEWSKLGARWLSQACHRSLYGYQMRTALALAVENPHVAVTFLPLACTGATIETGLLNSSRARETNCAAGNCPSTVPAQIAQLQQQLAAARRTNKDRALDLVLLTVGANDIEFSGLVANVIIEASTERVLVGRGVIASVEDAEAALARKLPRDFSRLRAALKPMLGGNLSKVVFVSYGNPALRTDGAPCEGGLDGFDVHPAFKLDSGRLRRVVDFVGNRFLPALKALVQCDGGTICQDPAADRMTFVDAHQAAFAGHGLCARSDQDPEYDRACFQPDGKTFTASPVEGATEPVACGLPVKEFRAYAPRARWIRTANDSYFVAMTYPDDLSATLKPTNIHDATWGVVSAVYGGAVHPTAEGHAAMADAALAAARRVLGYQTEPTVNAEPLPPPPGAPRLQ
jgi:lysophospholipase L1-like esterase